ncbi:hypothetical protein KA531_00020 [Candidatus Saccharibacteria bacterium]|nr:hypothetical protein [Candidatus Saccharibacteria bacterium]
MIDGVINLSSMCSQLLGSADLGIEIYTNHRRAIAFDSAQWVEQLSGVG